MKRVVKPIILHCALNKDDIVQAIGSKAEMSALCKQHPGWVIACPPFKIGCKWRTVEAKLTQEEYDEQARRYYVRGVRQR
jgi:hypothetical protein